MEIIKKIGLKIALLVLLLAGLNEVYKLVQWPADLKLYTNGYDELIDATDNADILFLGDCSDAYRASGLDHEKGIGEYLDELMTGQTVATLSSNGFHPGTYLQLLESSRDFSGKTVVVTLNLRAFAPKIINDYVYDPKIRKHLELLNDSYPPLLNRALLSYYRDPDDLKHQLEQKTLKAWLTDSLPPEIRYDNTFNWYYSYPNPDDIKLSDNDIAQSYIHDFGFLIDTSSNKRITQCDALLDLAHSRNWDLVFHIPAIDFNAAEEKVEPALAYLIERNLEILKHRYQNTVNNAHLLTSDHFVGPYAGSHYTAEGRKSMAIEISKFLGE